MAMREYIIVRNGSSVDSVLDWWAQSPGVDPQHWMSHTSWHMPVVSGLGKWRQEDLQLHIRFDASRKHMSLSFQKTAGHRNVCL